MELATYKRCDNDAPRLGKVVDNVIWEAQELVAGSPADLLELPCADCSLIDALREAMPGSSQQRLTVSDIVLCPRSGGRASSWPLACTMTIMRRRHAGPELCKLVSAQAHPHLEATMQMRSRGPYLLALKPLRRTGGGSEK
jgi:hypothetical protein